MRRAIVVCGLAMLSSVAFTATPVLLTSVCLDVTLSVSDKLNGPPFDARYVVTERNSGRTFQATRHVSDANSAIVHFPADFLDQKLGIEASINCYDGDNYSWQIFADNKLIDSGSFGFERPSKRESRPNKSLERTPDR